MIVFAPRSSSESYQPILSIVLNCPHVLVTIIVCPGHVKPVRVSQILHRKGFVGKTKLDGITFDSKKEAHRYWELKCMQQIGEIKDLKLQPEYRLQPGFVHQGTRYKPISYVADFEYRDLKTGELVVEDVKSKATRTQAYRDKVKRLLFQNPDVTFREV